MDNPRGGESQSVSEATDNLDRAISKARHTSTWLASDLYKQPLPTSSARRLGKPLPGLQSACEALRIFADVVRTSPDEFASLPYTLSAPIARWCVSAAAALELRSAAALYSREAASARVAANAAAALRALAAAEHARTPPGGADGNAERRGEDVQMEDVRVEERENPMFDGASVTGKRNAPARIIGGEATRLDDEAARADWLLALSYAVAGDITSARAAIDARASEALPVSSASPDSTEVAYLPAAYLSGALRVLSGECVQQSGVLHTCAARGHRTADCLALLARRERGAQGVRAWQRAVAVDYERPAALWLAAREFGEAGRERQQAELLRCLQEMMERTGEVGERGEALKLKEGVCSGNGLSVLRVRAARGRALCGAGEWDEAVEVLSCVQRELSSCAGDVYTAEIAQDVALDLGWASVVSGDVDGALPLLEAGAAAAGADWRKAGAALARAEGLLRTEKVDEAVVAVREGVRWLRVGEADDCAARRMLRGVAFHNLAVLRCCKEGAGAVVVDEAFAAAQAAFEKCVRDGEAGEGMKREAGLMGEAATFGRCLAMWESGRRVDAAGHWVAKRGEREGEVGDGKHVVVSHVMTEVPGEMVGRMDTVCGGVWKTAEARRRLREVVDEVTEAWPMRGE